MSMFKHSVPVPRLYKEASKLLQDVRENGVGLKGGLFKRKHPNLKAVLALVAETIQNFSQINLLIEKVNLSEKEPQLNIWLARILICELLWKNRELKGDSKPILTILNYRDELSKHKETLILPTSDTRVSKPRFVRVNTLKLTVEDAVNGFRDEGWNFVRTTNTTYEDFLSRVASLNFDEFTIDFHIKELLIFPPRTEFYAHRAYTEKAIVLQDKASCLPVHLLNPLPNSVVLDMCAAPGMKTTYIAALLKNEGVIYAVELNRRRFDLLNESLEGTEATCIKTINDDALKVTAEDCPNVEYILVDPSCSGSGMTNRILLDDKEKPNQNRLQTLARFQITILKHALTHFPQAKRVVYSTCSIYREENEDVVEEVLTQCRNFKLLSAKRLLNKEDNLELKEEDESVNEKCINFNCENDFTNGFFIAVFERIENQPEEKYHYKENKRKRTEDGETEQSDFQTKKKKNQLKRETKDSNEESSLMESEPKNKHNTELVESKEAIQNEFKKKKNKKHKSKVEDSLPEEQEKEVVDVVQESDHKPKKKKKSSKEQIEHKEETIIQSEKKKNKKYKSKVEDLPLPEEQEKEVDDVAQKFNRKSKKNKQAFIEIIETKKLREEIDSLHEENLEGIEVEVSKKIKKHKKHSLSVPSEQLTDTEAPAKKKKKKKNQ